MMRQLLYIIDERGLKGGAHIATEFLIDALQKRGYVVDVMQAIPRSSFWGIVARAYARVANFLRLRLRLRLSPSPLFLRDPFGFKFRQMLRYDTVCVASEESVFTPIVARLPPGVRKVQMIHTNYPMWAKLVKRDIAADGKLFAKFDCIACVGTIGARQFEEMFPACKGKVVPFHNIIEQGEAGENNRIIECLNNRMRGEKGGRVSGFGLLVNEKRETRNGQSINRLIEKSKNPIEPCRGGEGENSGRACCPQRAAIDSQTKDALAGDCAQIEPCRGGEVENGDNSTVQPSTFNLQPRTLDRRAMAEKKVAEWLEGVDDETFEAALEQLVEEKSAAGEYRFKRPEDRERAINGARQFYREFSRKIVPLSDGRFVYFAPDPRSKSRNGDNAISWAEYAFHAVSSSGKLLDGKNFRERLYNATKAADLPVLESVIKSEQCMYRLIDAYPENDAVIFVGRDAGNGRLEVVTRLDQFGNAEANLGEVTVIAKHKRKENPPPKFRPLTEVVEAVAKHQAAGFSPSTTRNNIANPSSPRKGGDSEREGVSTEGLGVRMNDPLTPNSCPLTPKTLRLISLARINDNVAKDGPRMIRVAKRLKDAGIDFVWENYGGSGNGFAACLQEVARLGLQDAFRIHPFDPNARAKIAEADLFVLLSHYEGLPNVIYESLLAGTPVFATGVGGIPEQVQEGVNGWLVEDDEDAIVQRLSAVLRDRAAIDSAKNGAMRFLYDNDTIVDEHLGFLS